jgi:hypothetical protein
MLIWGGMGAWGHGGMGAWGHGGMGELVKETD